MTSGGETDDRWASAIEGEMDRLRKGGFQRRDQSVGKPSLTRNAKRNSAHEGIVSVVGIINSESGHRLPQVEAGIGEAEGAEGR